MAAVRLIGSLFGNSVRFPLGRAGTLLPALQCRSQEVSRVYRLEAGPARSRS